MIVAGPNTNNIKGKHESLRRLRAEWVTLSQKNPALYSVVTYLSGYADLILGKPLTVTQIWRSEDEQKTIYGPHTNKKSPHQFYCAVDLRCKSPYYTKNERKVLEGALTAYDQFNQFRHLPSGSRTVWVHTVPGNAIHFHIQLWTKDNRQLPSFFQLPERDLSSIA